MAAVGVMQERCGLFVDGHRRAAGGAVDPRGEAVVAIARVLRFDARDVGNGRVRGAAGVGRRAGA